MWLAGAVVACAGSGRQTLPADGASTPSGAARARVDPAKLKSLLEREAELAAEAEDCAREQEQEQARRRLGCHPHRAAGLRFAAGSVELDQVAEGAVEALVERSRQEPGASMIVLGGRRADEGQELAGIDRRRAWAVREALVARGVPEQQIVTAAEFRAPAADREEVEVLWVCEVCCLL